MASMSPRSLPASTVPVTRNSLGAGYAGWHNGLALPGRRAEVQDQLAGQERQRGGGRPPAPPRLWRRHVPPHHIAPSLPKTTFTV